VRDLEVGGRYRTSAVDVQANVYSMNFHDEIAPIGLLSYIGSPLRKNVGASYRRGLEADVSYRATPRLTVGANLAASTNRIHEFTDSTGDVPVTHRDVEPLLTPRLLSAGRASFALTHGVTIGAETRYQSRSFLQNNGDARFVLPASFNVDGSVSWRVGAYELIARGNNLTNNEAFGSGYASGGVSYYFVVPPRNLFLTLKATF